MREAKGIEMEGFSPISRSEKKLYVEYMKHCLKEAADTPELAAVKRDVRKLEFLLKKYDRKKDPDGKEAMAIRARLACLAIDMPNRTRTPKSLREVLDTAYGLQMAKRTRGIEKAAFDIGEKGKGFLEKAGLLVAGASIATGGSIVPLLVAGAVAIIGKYIIDNIPDRTKESFDDMTGAFQAAFTKSLEVEGVAPKELLGLVDDGFCSIRSDGRISIPDDPNVAIEVVEALRDQLRDRLGERFVNDVEDGIITPRQLQRTLNDLYGNRLGMDREVTDISKSLEGNYFIATGKGMKEKETVLEKLDR